MTYIVFVGWDRDDQEDFSFRQEGLSWDAARAALADRLRPFETDTCEECREAGTKELGRLLVAAPGQFEGFVDGDFYLIIPQP